MKTTTTPTAKNATGKNEKNATSNAKNATVKVAKEKKVIKPLAVVTRSKIEKALMPLFKGKVPFFSKYVINERTESVIVRNATDEDGNKFSVHLDFSEIK